MSEIIFWAADNVDLWRTFAIEALAAFTIAALAAFTIACLTFAAAMVEEIQVTYDWDAHWAKLAADAAGREDEIVALAHVLHDVFEGRAWACGDLDCWCGTFDETGNNETFHPDPSTNCWRLAACIVLAGVT